MPTLQNGVLRTRPRINVTRGYTGNEPGNITLSAPLNTAIDNAAADSTVYSGQAVVLESAGTFNLASASDASSKVYFAYHDSTDTDVDSCGKLLGFAALGNFEIETPWVDTDSLSVGDALKLSATDGTLAVADPSTDGGKIVGYVTEIRDLGVGGHTSANPRGGVAGTIPEDSTSDPYVSDTSGVEENLKIVKLVVAAD